MAAGGRGTATFGDGVSVSAGTVSVESGDDLTGVASTMDVTGSESVHVESAGSAIDLGDSDVVVSASRTLDIVSGESVSVSSESVSVSAGGAMDVTASDSVHVSGESVSVDALSSLSVSSVAAGLTVESSLAVP